jgi:hypothetical protein
MKCQQSKLIEELQITMGFDKLENQGWVLESPDQGKTITRRRAGQTDKFLLENISGRWHSMDELRELARRQDREQVIRDQYPAAQEAWEMYQALLQVIDPDIDNRKEK